MALHVRRGDKLNTFSQAPTTKDYYRLAIDKIYELTSKPEFFVFSDELDWCREFLPQVRSDAILHFIDGQTPPQDMALMTKCKHVITAPSTFSWWGAWLNENPDKIIIAPKTPYSTERNPDFLPEEWIKI